MQNLSIWALVNSLKYRANPVKKESKNRFFASNGFIILSIKMIFRSCHLLYKPFMQVRFQAPSSKHLGGVLLTRYSNYNSKMEFAPV